MAHSKEGRLFSRVSIEARSYAYSPSKHSPASVFRFHWGAGVSWCPDTATYEKELSKHEGQTDFHRPGPRRRGVWRHSPCEPARAGWITRCRRSDRSGDDGPGLCTQIASP